VTRSLLVFSAVEGRSEDNDTSDGLRERWVSNWTSTDVGDVRDDTGATLEETETGTRDETEDATFR